MNDEIYINRCLQLAKNGLGTTYPNPLVGSIVVFKNKIIGEGFHIQSGKPHAEVIAIKSVKNPILLQESILYVNLEPCSHFGKTPPCSELIIKNKIPKVVVGMLDPYSEVNGEGIKQLKLRGIEVKLGVCEEKCLELNKRFLTFHNKNRPYIFLKFAKSLDGLLNSNFYSKKKPFYISNKQSLQQVHYRRIQEQAILIGKNTAIKDNPKLNTRFVGNNLAYPIRIVLDRKLEILNYKLNLFKGNQKTWIYNITKNIFFSNIECIKVDKKNSLNNILNDLHKKNIQSLIVEGGKTILESFINQNLWDEAEIYTGSFFAKKGIKTPFISGNLIERYSILDNDFIRIKNS